MCLSVCNAIRLSLGYVATDQALPFEIKAPNAETRAAISELERGADRSFDNAAAEPLADLNAWVERQTGFAVLGTAAGRRRFDGNSINNFAIFL